LSEKAGTKHAGDIWNGAYDIIFKETERKLLKMKI